MSRPAIQRGQPVKADEMFQPLGEQHFIRVTADGANAAAAVTSPMEREQYAELLLSPLGYEDGLEEIDSFYRAPVSVSQQQYEDVAQVLDEDRKGSDAVAEDKLSTLLPDLKAMEGIEAIDDFGPVLANSNVGEDERENESSASISENTASEVKSNPPVPTGQTPKASSPTIPLDLFASTKTTPGSSHDPIPPSSSNRSELQAEMRGEEIEQNSTTSTPGAVPFSIPQTRSGAKSKRNASASPSAIRRPAKKAKDAESEAILTGSPGAHSKLPPRDGALSMATEMSMNFVNGPQDVELERDVGRRSLVVVMPLPQRTLRGKLLASKMEPADQDTLDAKSQDGTSRSSLKEKGMQDDSRAVVSEAPSLPPKPSARTRRTMGAHELKDILDTNSRKGVAGDMTPGRMTRGQKQERDAARPNAKEAVMRRRQSSGK
ncbi:hypothetical protein CERZMDRAFT_94074 [Cercospora zeae-maydis SCOH1-5]|uniref:Uncharacterized protein n=1 Tax=Cercospora zeae-maydis SCOH1-5 TaxID=717836 RepID=A0A6A6FQD6_9PEZI|nr:hypothetical protein CERZMDRAFT_94074 [Cercospora zeae-maydis SCOH1-5]